jgi:hypothetical protein
MTIVQRFVAVPLTFCLLSCGIVFGAAQQPDNSKVNKRDRSASEKTAD